MERALRVDALDMNHAIHARVLHGPCQFYLNVLPNVAFRLITSISGGAPPAQPRARADQG